MQKFIRNGIVCLLLLSPVFCRAKTPVTHEFSKMSIPSEIQFSNSNKVAKTDLLTYTCSGEAVFGAAIVSPLTQLSINFPKSKKNVEVITTAIDSLASIKIWRVVENDVRDNVIIYLSRDGEHWVTAESAYSADDVTASFVPGRYYVRLTNPTGNKTSIYKIKYTFGDCNCVLYIPEE